MVEFIINLFIMAIVSIFLWSYFTYIADKKNKDK